jgi:hypothetical protein
LAFTWQQITQSLIAGLWRLPKLQGGKKKKGFTVTTTFSNKAQILADLWTDYRDDEDFQDFIVYNDLGLPLAYALANGIIEESSLVENFIDETFSLLLLGLEIKEDTGFYTLEEILSAPMGD